MERIQAQNLGIFTRAQREAKGLSTRQLASEVGVHWSQIIRLEQGTVASPRAELLARIAEVLNIHLADLYGLAGYTRPTELPSFVPYLRAKYSDLPVDAVAEMEQFFAKLAEKHGTAGPADGEDEK